MPRFTVTRYDATGRPPRLLSTDVVEADDLENALIGASNIHGEDWPLKGRDVIATPIPGAEFPPVNTDTLEQLMTQPDPPEQDPG
jgi:hypothetical protein